VWKQALAFAKEKFDAENIQLTFKDGPTSRTISYLEFTQNVMKIFINELNRKNDYLLCLIALCRIPERTSCTVDEIKDQFKLYRGDMLCEFLPIDFSNIDSCLGALLEANNHLDVTDIVLAEILCYLRLEKCPREDWQQDLQYYSAIEDKLIAFGNLNEVLVLKIKDQIKENKENSRNRNKTAEELFAGWDD